MSSSWVLGLALVALAPAQAKSVPIVSLGDACQQVAARETAAGARPKYDVERMLHNRFLLFTDAESSPAREALYECSADGTVSAFSQNLSTPNSEVARAAYATLRGQLRSRLGRPLEDSQTASLPRRIALWRAHASTFSTYETTRWESERGNPTLTLQKPRDSSDWQLLVIEPAAASVRPSRSSLLAAALTGALCSSAIVTALCLTPLGRFRRLLAVATPLAIAWELRWTGSEAASPWMASFLVCLASGALPSALVVHAWRRDPSTPVTGAAHSGERLLLAGSALLAALYFGLSWLFRFGQDPTAPLHGAGLFLCAPLALLLATLLLYLGTARMANTAALAGTALRSVYPRVLQTVGVIGTVGALTLCLNVCAEISLAL